MRAFPFRPDAESLKARASACKIERKARDGICDRLASQADTFSSGPEARANISKLRKPETSIVITYLQPGLFGGDLRSWLKVFTAARLASWLSENGHPAVPIAWFGAGCLPATAIVSRNGLRKFEIPDIGQELPEQTEQVLDDIGRDLGLGDSGGEAAGVFQVLRSAYRRGRICRIAWAETVARLLDFCGIVLHDRGALAAEMRLPDLPAAAVVFDEAEAEAMNSGAEPAPAANAPVFWPRASATVMTRRDGATLERYGVDKKYLFSGSRYIIDKINQKMNVEATREQLGNLQSGVERRLSELEKSGAEPQSGLAQARRRLQYQAGKLGRTFFRAVDQRERAMARQIASVCNALAPWGMLQERELAGFQFIYRHSASFPQELFQAVDIWKFEHQWIQL